MPGERIPRRIDRSRDGADEAAERRDWSALLEQARAVRASDEQTEGDPFIIAFQSARDALRCAQAMQQRPDERKDGAARAANVRVGLHTREPVRDGDDFHGTHMAMASRIASLAGGGEILVSALMRELVASSGEFTLEAREPVALKGLDGDHVTYRVEWAR